MSTTHASADPTTGTTLDADTHRFRAPTIEAALTEARSELGDVEIVEANRIRRGGVGGFFATDLGVELLVRPASHTTRPVPVEDEYVDTSMPASLPRSADRIDARGDDDRPPFYDRMREEVAATEAARAVAAADDAARPVHPHAESITAELERLLTAATTAERTAAVGRPLTRSFADHLADHLDPADRPTTRPAGGGTGRTDRASARPAATEPTDRTTIEARVTEERTPRPPAAEAKAPAARRVAEPAPETAAQDAAPAEQRTDPPTAERRVAEAAARRVARTTPAEVPTAVETPEVLPAETVVEPRSDAASSSTRRSAPRTPAPRDPWRKSIDLAAGAVGRLVEQLSDVAPADGSRMRSLSRLTVSVTTPDGAVIELTAELEGDE